LLLREIPVSTDPLPVFPILVPSSGLKSDDLLAYECGMRAQASERFSWDLALFYNQYTNLAALVSGEPQFEPPGYIVIPTQYMNAQNAETYGVELGANYQVNERWRLQAAYTYLSMFLHGPPDVVSAFDPGDNPCNQFYLQSSWNWSRDWTFDLIGRYVDSLNSTIFVPSYVAFDTRLAWHPRKNLEVSVVGRNLCRGTYYEFTSDPGTGLIPTKVGPQVYGQFAWRY
jgi:iron complex outermembrane receptor protein